MTRLTRKKGVAWRSVFLDTLRESANVRAACASAGVSRQTAYQHREAAPDFAAAWDEALQDACDVLEAEAWQRARSTSDTLLIFLLKAHRPEKYRETFNVKHSGSIDVTRLSDEELEKIARGQA